MSIAIASSAVRCVALSPSAQNASRLSLLEVIGDEEDAALVQIAHDGRVVGPALERLLIDADVAEGERRAALQAARDRAALDPPHRVPPEFQLAADRGHGGFPQPVDRQPLDARSVLKTKADLRVLVRPVV